jgi:hypothetical protein
MKRCTLGGWSVGALLGVLLSVYSPTSHASHFLVTLPRRVTAQFDGIRASPLPIIVSAALDEAQKRLVMLRVQREGVVVLVPKSELAMLARPDLRSLEVRYDGEGGESLCIYIGSHLGGGMCFEVNQGKYVGRMVFE